MNEKILGLIDELNKATLAYDEGKPYMSDEQWDEKYFELVELEAEHNFYDSNSPTQKVVYQVVNALEKVEHSHQMLSLDKTKSLERVAAFIGKHSYLAMCKMDGLTCSLTYVDGRLVSAETRGNGVIGEDILHNALVIPSIPNTIPYKSGRLLIRTLRVFQVSIKIQETLPQVVSDFLMRMNARRES